MAGLFTKEVTIPLYSTLESWVESILLRPSVSCFLINVLTSMSVLNNTTAGNIIQYGGFRVAFHAMGGAFVISLILVITWMPETAFHRQIGRAHV